MNRNLVQGKGKNSHFDINLLKHCFNVLNKIEMTPNIRYRTSLILASLQNLDTTAFLTTFLTKISRVEFLQLYTMATIDIEKSKEFLKSNIKTDGMSNLFEQFLVPKNKEVLIFYLNHL